MNIYSNQKAITLQGNGLRTVASKMVMNRERELAIINGYSTENVFKSDWDQAKAELLGGSGSATTITESSRDRGEDGGY